MIGVPKTPLSIVVSHREPLIAIGAAHWLAQDTRLQVAVTDDADDWRAADVVVTDYNSGLQRAAALAANTSPRPRPKLLVITAERREHEVRRALEAGVHGYLLTDCPMDELQRCVHALGAGSRYFNMAVAQAMADSLSREALTCREQEVLALLVRGQTNKVIARSLSIALGTVKSHVKSLMAKLDAHSRTEVVAVATARGLAQTTAPEAPEPVHRPMRAMPGMARELLAA